MNDPQVWGPRYWFVLHTIAQTYPLHPNKVTRRKYYDFFMNLPLFVPDIEMGDYLSYLLDVYPVSAFLDNRDHLVKWIWAIHNKINVRLGKPEVGFIESLEIYKRNYQTSLQKQWFDYASKRRWIALSFICIVVLMIWLVYRYS